MPGQVDADGFPTTPARLCLGATGTEHCYTPPSDKPGFVYGLDPKAKTIGRRQEKDLILFEATYSGGGSGLCTSMALLEQRDGEAVNLLPKLLLSEQSEYKVWNLPQLSGLPVLVTANFMWDFGAMKKSDFKEETHFAPHRYTVAVYTYDRKSARYLQRLRFATSKKYPGLDDAEEIKVLEAERPTILAKLRQSKPN